MTKHILNRAAFSTLVATSISLATAASSQGIPITPEEDIFKKIREQTAKGAPAVIQWMQSNGTKLTYLGNAGGLDGYLGETPSGSLQTFYVTPDGQHVIAGLLFRQGGINLTGVQMDDLQNRYEDAKRRAAKAGDDLRDLKPENVPSPKATTSLIEVPAQAVANGEVKLASAEEFLSSRDAEKLSEDLENSPWFQVGAPDAPVLYMVADPNCPFCHKAWATLKPLVMTREIAVRVILIAALKDSEAKTISILSRDNPSRVWMTGEGSVRTTPVAKPPAASSPEFKRAQSYLRKNMDFVHQNEIQSTPHFFYLDEEKRLFEKRGLPRDFDAFLEELRKK